MKTYRWLTLVAALLITLCEVLVFNSQAARGAQKQDQMHEIQSGSVDIPGTAGQTLR